ncbi:MAG: amidohydrolase [Cryomorphaceae bacterium]|nr:MAG: amidohydrolase [Cryomorphaceae bacterium]
MRFSIAPLLASLLFLILFSCHYQHMDADLIIHNATIYTMDAARTKAEAMAIKDGVVLATGPEREILNRYSAPEKIDARKQPVYPGFIDAHCHFLYYGQSLREAELMGSSSMEEVIERLQNATPGRGGWLLGRGWDQNEWEDKNFPTSALLDAAFPDVPVYITRVDGHAAVVNKKALELAGIDSSREVEGGKIETANGIPTGLLIDRAMELVQAVIPPFTDEDIEAAVKLAQDRCFAAGITSVADAGLPASMIRKLHALDESGVLKMHIYQMLSPDDEAESWMQNGHFESEHIVVRSLKLFSDGALGSRGAAMIEPYSDDPGNYGLILNPASYYQKWAGRCTEYNYQLVTHAIGDSANREVLGWYAHELGGTNDKRWRIEHAQVVHPNDIEKFGQYSIIPSMQPTHATSDMFWAVDRLGERIGDSYRLETLRQQLGMVPLGTDFPIEGIDPLQTFFAAVFRTTPDGRPEGGFQMEDALSREHTLMGMTMWAAIANFEENRRGSLEPGKMADVVILNRDLMTASAFDFKNIEVQMTLVKGEKVYQAY